MSWQLAAAAAFLSAVLAVEFSVPFEGVLWLVACYTHTMSKRLQVLLADEEMSDIRILAQREHLTVGEWVRRTLREARAQKSVKDPEAKLRAIRRAVENPDPPPAVDIDQMLREIEQGYQS
jgi:hypothetical protein